MRLQPLKSLSSFQDFDAKASATGNGAFTRFLSAKSSETSSLYNDYDLKIYKYSGGR